MGSMTRMIDRLIAKPVNLLSGAKPEWRNWWSQTGERVFRRISLESQHLVVDNVAQYAFNFADKTWNTRKDFPSLRPPFPTLWMEYQLPDWEQGGPIPVTAKEYARMSEVGTLVIAKPDNSGNYQIDSKFFINSTVAGILFVGGISLRVDEYGVVLNDLDGNCEYLETYVSNYSKEGVIDGIGYLMIPFWLALSFLNCKNVAMVPHDPSLNVHRHKVKAHPKPRVKYHTLEITPMKEVLRKEGDIEHNGLKMALHICRGHFKDYREHGLFGRQKGLYWWDSHVRGSLKEGVVIKDYKVNEPRPPTP